MRRRTVIGGLFGVSTAGCLRLTEGEANTTSNATSNSDGPDDQGTTDGSSLTSTTAWPQFQVDGGNTGVHASGSVPSSDPGVHWERNPETVSRGGLVASTDHVIERLRNRVVAYEKTTGDVAWETTETLVDEFSLNCDPVIYNDRVVFAGRNRRTGDRGVFVVDAGDGQRAWALAITEDDEFFHGVTRHADRIYLVSRNNETHRPSIRAISLAERELLWTYEITDYDHLNRPVAATDSIVAFGGHMEYERTGSTPEAGDSPGGVTALDPATGSELWRAEVGGTQTPVTIANGLVYATPDKNELHHAALQDGGPYPIIALDVEDGAVSWRYEARNTFYNSPAVTEEHVYFGADSSLYAVSATDGTPVWRHTVDGHVERQSPLVVGDAVLFGDYDFQKEQSKLHVVDAATGDERWTHAVPEQVVSDSICVDGAVFIKARTFGDEDSATVRGLW